MTTRDEARAESRDRAAECLAFATLMHRSERKPVLKYVCAAGESRGRGSCTLLEVYQAPGGDLVYWRPAVTTSSRNRAESAGIVRLLMAASEGRLVDLVECKHYSFSFLPTRIEEDVRRSLGSSGSVVEVLSPEPTEVSVRVGKRNRHG